MTVWITPDDRSQEKGCAWRNRLKADREGAYERPFPAEGYGPYYTIVARQLDPCAGLQPVHLSIAGAACALHARYSAMQDGTARMTFGALA